MWSVVFREDVIEKGCQMQMVDVQYINILGVGSKKTDTVTDDAPGSSGYEVHGDAVSFLLKIRIGL